MDYPFELNNRVEKVGNRKYKIKSADLDVVNPITGECGSLVLEANQKVFLDGTEFVKIYDILPFKELDINGLRVFGYMIGIMGFDGIVRFNIEQCMDSMRISRSSVNRGLKQLRELDIIKRVGGIYYMNWNIAFRGNRDSVRRELSKRV